MQTFQRLVDETTPSDVHELGLDELMRESLQHSRRRYIRARRSLPVSARDLFDKLEHRIMRESLGAPCGVLTIDHDLLVSLLREGWIVLPRSDITTQ